MSCLLGSCDANCEVVNLHEQLAGKSTDFEIFTKNVCALLEGGCSQSRQTVWDERSNVYNRLMMPVEKQPDTEVDDFDMIVHGGSYGLLRMTVRTVLRMEQHLFSEWTAERRKSDGSESQRIITVLMTVVADQNCPLDIVFLAGTAFAFHLHSLDIQPHEAASLFIKMSLASFPENLPREALPLMHGILACGKSNVLLAECDSSCPEEQTLLVLRLFPPIAQFCKANSGGREYQSFQTLLAWLRFIQQHASRLLSADSRLIDDVMRLLDLGWASPVSGVSDLSWDAFGIFFDVCRSEELTTRLLRSALNMSWKAKGKYPRLAAILKYVKTSEVLLDRTSFLEELSSSLASNRLSSASCVVYRTFLMQFRSELKCYSNEDIASKWNIVIAPSLLRSLRSSESLTRHNAIRHWLPVTLQLFPSSFELIMQHLTDDQSPESFLVQMSTLKLSRSQGIVDSQALELPVVHLALRHLDDEVRAEAFALVCLSKRKSEGLSDVEFSFVKEFLPINLNVDCASFRRRILCHFRVFLVRFRDFLIRQCHKPYANQETLLKTDPELHEMLLKAAGFMNWLLGVVRDGLVPGGNYQRRSTCLSLYGCMLDTFVSSPTGHQRKGTVPPKCERLLTYLHQVGDFRPLSSASRRHLLFCIFDPMDEVQSAAATLLANHFSNVDGGDVDLIGNDRLALRLGCSPKTMIAHSGAHLLWLSYRKADSNVKCELLRSTVTELTKQYAVARTSMLQASIDSPMHGLLLFVRLALCSQGEVVKPDRAQEWQRLLCDCFDIAEQILGHILGVLSARSSHNSVSPSFAEMGIAIEDVVGMESNSMCYSTSTEHQLVLSCCWLSLKESCLLIGNMVRSFLNTEIENRVDRAARLFVDVLTKCRHRGVIESCNVAFELFCKRLMDTGEQRLIRVVGCVLDDALSELEVGANALLTSVTRRSAGLPLLIATVVRCDRRPCTPFLTDTIARLLAVARKPLPKGEGLVDLPQVHAFHVFRALAHDARLSQDVLRHVVPMTLSCLDGFRSTSWAVRNAVLQLFGALVPMIVGQRKASASDLDDDNDDGTSCDNRGTPTITFSEFVGRWPQLAAAIEDHLKASVIVDAPEDSSSSSSSSSRSVSDVPVLSLLCSLSPRDDSDSDIDGDSEQLSERLLELVRPLLGSRVWHVRLLAALFVARTCPPCRRHVIFLESACRLCQGNCETPANARHGTLVLLKHLLVAMQPPCNADIKEDIRRVMMDIVRLSVNDWSSCPVLGASALEMCAAAPDWIFSSVADIPDIFAELLSNKFQMLQLHSFKPGFSLYLKRVHQTILRNISASDLCNRLPTEKLRASQEELEVIPIAFARAVRKPSKFSEIGSKHQTDIVGERLLRFLHVCSATESASLLVAALEMAFDAYDRVGIRLRPQHEALQFVKSLVGQISHGQHASAVALALWATVITDDWAASDVQSFVSCLLQFCKPRFSEHFRLWAAKSLRNFGFPDCSKVSNIANGDNIIVGIFDSSMTLLQDEQADVRREATKFVESVVFNDTERPSCLTSNVHPNLAMQMLSDHFVRHFGSSEQYRDHLWRKIGGFDDLSCISKRLLAASGDTNNSGLFEQDAVNVYAEKCFMNRFYGKTILSLLSEFPSNSKWLGITNVLARARLVVDLEPSLLASGSLNLEWYCRPKVFNVVARIGVQLDVALSLIDDAKHRDDLQDVRKLLWRRTAWPSL